MKKKIKFGESIDGGFTKDIMAVFNGTSLTGEEPFAGKPISFIPIPKGYKGKDQEYIHKKRTLAEIVAEEENCIYKMGSNPDVYYEYKDSWCHGYYG